MAELERDLRRLAAALEWPATPTLPAVPEVRARGGRRELRRLVLACAAALAALAVALAVPAARSAILRVLHLGGVTVERVNVLPPARERPLAAYLGPVVDAATATRALGTPFRLPKLNGTPRLHLRDGVVALLLATPQPVLLSEFDSGGFFFKKLLASTSAAGVEVGTDPGLWVSGAQHVLIVPGAPPRLAGNTLIWQHGTITYRLEGPALTEQAALTLAREIGGT